MMKRKLVAVLLATCTMVASLTGCGSNEESVQKQSSSQTQEVAEESTSVTKEEEKSIFNEEGYPIVNEEITLKVMQSVRETDNLIDPDDMPSIQKLEELTGINLEWEVVKTNDWDTKLNLMFASGEYADIILGTHGVVDIEKYGVSEGALIPLDELIEKYIPNYTERINLEENDPTMSLRGSDGQAYTVGFMTAQNINANQHLFINQAWLDELKLETPKNVEDLTEVLRAFKTQDFNGNGEDDEIPLELALDRGIYGYTYILPLFGIPANGNLFYIDEDKNVQFAAKQPGFRECVEWLHTLYTEGITDPELISQDSSAVASKLAIGNLGFYPAWRITVMGFNEELVEDSVLWTPEEGTKMYKTMELARGCAYITSTNKYPEATARLFNAMLDTEMMFSLYYGEQGDTVNGGWDYNEEGKIYTIDASSEVTAKNCLDVNALFFAPGKYYFDVYEPAPQRIEKTEYCEIYTEAGLMQTYSNDYLNFVRFSNEKAEELAQILVDLKSAVDEHVGEFVMNGVTDANWDSFMKVLDDIKLDEYLQAYQDGLDQLEIE